MKLGMIEQPTVEGLEHAKSLGLEFVEYDCNPVQYSGWPVEELNSRTASLKEASERTGVEVGAVGRWASRILDSEGKTIPEEMAETKGIIDFGAALGAKYFLCSCNYVPELSYYKNITAAIRVLNEVVSYARDRGMESAIVNCAMGDNYIRTPEQWKLVLDEVPGLGIKYDPSHSFVHGGPKGAYMDESIQWGDRFTYCHIKGVIQRGESQEMAHMKDRKLIETHPELREEFIEQFKHYKNDRYDNPPAGLDSINWRAFFGALYMHGYDGYLSIEPHSMTWRGEKGELGLKYTIKYIRDLMILD